MTKVRPDIAVRVIDVDRPGVQGIDWGSPVLRQYDVHSLPAFMIVGADGKTIAQGRDAYKQVLSLLDKELN